MVHLAGDIGGTNARFATYVDGTRTGSVDLSTPQYENARDMLADAVAALPRGAVDACCLAVAGPVFGTEAKLTNAGIAFSETVVANTTGSVRTVLVNDMVALGTAIAELPASRFERLSGREEPSAGERDGLAPSMAQAPRGACDRGARSMEGRCGLGPEAARHKRRARVPSGCEAPDRLWGARKQATRGVLAAGTGLGMGIVVDGRCLPSEGGHARVAPAGDLERELVAVTERECREPVSWEHYLSGRGLVALYRAVNAVWGAKAKWTTPETIIEHGGDGADPVCDTTLEAWAGLLATAAGGLAVTALTLGGVYLAGGVAVAVQDRLRTPLFRRRFEGAAWSADYLSDLPVYLVADPHTALDGAAAIAARAAHTTA